MLSTRRLLLVGSAFACLAGPAPAKTRSLEGDEFNRIRGEWFINRLNDPAPIMAMSLERANTYVGKTALFDEKTLVFADIVCNDPGYSLRNGLMVTDRLDPPERIPDVIVITCPSRPKLLLPVLHFEAAGLSGDPSNLVASFYGADFTLGRERRG